MATATRYRGFTALLAVGMMAAVSGCEPPPIVTAPPPGVDPRTTIEVKEDASQALGESAGQEAASVRAPVPSNTPPALPTAPGEEKTTASGVRYTTVKEGTGPTAKAGDRVSMHYIGTLMDGRKFDSSRDKNQAYEFTLGLNNVIKGWEEGVPGMKVGEHRTLTIPPSAAYGAQGRPPAIPHNATLKFEIELLNIK